MKKWMVYVLGVLSGLIIMGFINTIKLTSDDKVTNDTEGIIEERDDRMNLFEEPGEIIKAKSFQVFQVLAKDAALVRGESKYSDIYTGMIYLLINKEGKLYYDEEIVKVPKGSVVRQIGIYQYPTKDDFIKTVPIIQIMGE